MVNRDLILQLAEYYEKKLDVEHWGYAYCIAGVLYSWEKVPGMDADSVGNALGISYSDAYKLVFLDGAVADGDEESNLGSILRVMPKERRGPMIADTLRRYLATGRIEFGFGVSSS